MTDKKRTLIRAGGNDNGEVVCLAQSSVENNVVVQILNVVVTDDAHETDLVVDNEQSGIVLIDPLKLVCGDCVDQRFISHSPQEVKAWKVVNQPRKATRNKVAKRARSILFFGEQVKATFGSTVRALEVAGENQKADGDCWLRKVQLLYHLAQ